MNKDISVALMAMLIVLGLSFGLSQMRPDLPLTPSAPYTPGKAAGVASAAKPGKVVMRVNGEPVTEDEFMALLSTIPEQQRGVASTPAGKRQIAEEIVRMKALEQEGRRLGIENDPQVAAQMELLRTNVAAQRTMQKIVQERAEKEIVAAYEREKKNALSLRHIVLAYQGGMVPPKQQGAQPPAAEQATQRAAALVARLRGGADFAQVARTESDDAQTAPSGGTIGLIGGLNLPPELASVVSRLRPGQVSDPVRTDLGIHIFSVVEASFQDLRPMLMQQVQNEIAQREVERLQKAAKVDLDPQFFPPAPAMPAQPGQQPPPQAGPPGRG